MACDEFGTAHSLCRTLSTTNTTTTTTTIINDDEQQSMEEENENKKKPQKTQQKKLLLKQQQQLLIQKRQQDKSRRELFLNHSNGLLHPLLRYCRHRFRREVGSGGGDDDDDVENDNDFKVQEDTLSFEDDNDLNNNNDDNTNCDDDDIYDHNDNKFSVTFRGQKLRVDNSKLQNVLEKVEQIRLHPHNKKKEKINDNDVGDNNNNEKQQITSLLDKYNDAIAIASNDISTMTKDRHQHHRATALLSYCTFQKLKLLMQRNESIVHDLKLQLDSYQTSSSSTIINTDNNSDDDVGIAVSGEAIVAAASSRTSITDNMEQKFQYLEEIVHLYDIILRDSRAVTVLPTAGLDDDTTIDDDDGDEDDEFLLEAQANVLRIRALRCYYIGTMFEESLLESSQCRRPNQIYNKASVFFGRASELASIAAEEISACDGDGDDVTLMVELCEEAKIAKCRMEARLYLSSQGVDISMDIGFRSSNNGDNSSFLNILDRFGPSSQCVNSSSRSSSVSSLLLPSTTVPILTKPTFFDVAGNYLTELPEDELQRCIDLYCNQSGANTTTIIGSTDNPPSSNKGLLSWLW